MIYGFVVIAWLIMSGLPPVPFATMEACEAALSQTKGNVCVPSGAVDFMAPLEQLILGLATKKADNKPKPDDLQTFINNAAKSGTKYDRSKRDEFQKVVDNPKTLESLRARMKRIIDADIWKAK